MKWLYTDKRSKLPSASKAWKNIAYGVATFVIIKNADGIAWDLLLVYMAVVGASEVAIRLLDAKFPTPREGKDA
jgi:hypothetical protein